MAVADISVRVSDLSDKQGQKEAFGRLVVTRYPGLTAPVQLDVLPEEVAKLQSLDDVVQLNWYEPGSDGPKTLMVHRGDFDGLATATDMEKVLANGRGVRGRRAKTEL
jgi:hypothetical protein